MNFKLHTYILTFCLSISFSVFSQERNFTVSQINHIKKTDNYIYAEVTMPEQQQAKDGAMALLKLNIDSWLKSSKLLKDDLDLSQFNSCVKVMNAKRGKQHRVFVYISKSDLIKRKEKEKEKETTSMLDKKENTTICTNAQIIDLTDSMAVVANTSVNNDLQSYQLNDIEKEMVSIKRFDEIKPFVENLKAQKHLNRFGKYATLPKKGKIHMFIYSRTGDIVACLLKTDSKYYNLRTKSSDKIDNYKKCGSIWLEIIK